jgi:hypothetical protein
MIRLARNVTGQHLLEEMESKHYVRFKGYDDKSYFLCHFENLEECILEGRIEFRDTVICCYPGIAKKYFKQHKFIGDWCVETTVGFMDMFLSVVPKEDEREE